VERAQLTTVLTVSRLHPGRKSRGHACIRDCMRTFIFLDGDAFLRRAFLCMTINTTGSPIFTSPPSPLFWAISRRVFASFLSLSRLVCFSFSTRGAFRKIVHRMKDIIHSSLCLSKMIRFYFACRLNKNGSANSSLRERVQCARIYY